MTTRNRIRNLLSLKGILDLVLVALLLVMIRPNVQAQPAGSQDEILVVADEMPSFPGGPKALMDLVYKNITYPEDAKDKGIEGKVIVRFVIDKEGKAGQASISKGLCPSIDKVVLNVINKIPKFIPGKMAGKPVSVWFALPITFKLEKE
jgi:periplasmic protein TonB